jgi:hypothetical protein
MLSQKRTKFKDTKRVNRKSLELGIISSTRNINQTKLPDAHTYKNNRNSRICLENTSANLQQKAGEKKMDILQKKGFYQ